MKWKQFQMKFTLLFCTLIFQVKSQWTNNPSDDRFLIPYATASVFIQDQVVFRNLFAIITFFD